MLAPVAAVLVVLGFANLFGFMAADMRSQTGASSLHEFSVFVTHPLALASGAYLLFTFSIGPFVYGALDPDSEAERCVREAGSPLIRGDYGMVSPLRGLSTVALYEDGLWIKPLLMRPYGVPLRTITRIESIASWGDSTLLTISFSGATATSPVILRCGKGDSLECTLRDLLAPRNTLTSAST